MSEEDCAPLVVCFPSARAPRKIAVRARPSSPTYRVVSCCAKAWSDPDLRGISLYLHAFDFVFEKGCSYTVSFDSQFLPRNIILNDLEATGNGARSNMIYPVKHAFSETMDRCFIEKRS